MLTGVVRDSATRAPVRDAEVVIPELSLRTRTDARGLFKLDEIESGHHAVIVRKIGYDSTSALLAFSGADSSAHDFEIVVRAHPIAPVAVRGKSEGIVSAKLRDFERRREKGIGHFITADDLAKQLDKRTGDVIQKIPGTIIVRARGMDAYVGVSRGEQTLDGTTARICVPGKGCTRSGICASAVYLDGVEVFGGSVGEPAFDVNTLQVSAIAAIEFYSGPAQMPAEFNRTRSTCGALVIWTK